MKDLFTGRNYEDVLKLNKQCRINLNILKIYKVPTVAIELISAMLQADPNHRITIEQALKHPFFEFKVVEKQLVNQDEKKKGFQKNKQEIKTQQFNENDCKNSIRIYLYLDMMDDLDQGNVITNIPILDAKGGSLVMKQDFQIIKVGSQPQKPAFKKFQTNEWQTKDLKPQDTPFQPSFILRQTFSQQEQHTTIREDDEDIN